MDEYPTPAKLNPNVWYHVTESRVDTYDKKKFESMFQIVDVAKNNGDHLAVWPNVNPPQYWQFLPVDAQKPARYAVRSSVRGVKKQLGTCFNKDEIDERHTQPCLLRSDGSDTQKWDITYWPGDNSTCRFQNVQNGTGFNMDVHMGNPPFMSSETDPRIFQKAQRWLMTSVSKINDGAFSTTFTDIPFTTATSAYPSKTDQSTSPTAAPNSSPHSGLSSGAAAGVGIGVGLGVIALLIAGFLLWRRRKRANSRGAYSPTSGEVGDGHHQEVKHGGSSDGAPGPLDPYKNADQVHEMMDTPAPQGVNGQMQYELDAAPAPGKAESHNR